MAYKNRTKISTQLTEKISIGCAHWKHVPRTTLVNYTTTVIQRVVWEVETLFLTYVYGAR